MDALKTMSEPERVGSLVLNFGLTRSQAAILLALYHARGRVVTDDALRAALYPIDADEPETNVIKVFIYQLRQRFGVSDILHAHRCGYALSAAGIARVDEVTRKAA